MSDISETEQLRGVLATLKTVMTNIGPGADLSRKNLRNMKLDGKMMRRAKLSGSDLQNASLARADLSEADLFGANLTSANLQGADLRKATLRGVKLKGANLNHSNLQDADFRGGVIMDASGSSSIGLNITDLSECLAEYANAERSQMSGVNLSGASLIGANLSGAKLFGANLATTNLAYANLTGADLTDARLTGTSLVGANLTGAILTNAIVGDTNFQAANLDKARIEGIDMSKCLVGEVPIKPADAMAEGLRSAIDAHELWLATSGNEGAPAAFENMDLSHFSLTGRNLSGIVMRRCRLLGTDLSGCQLILSTFIECDFHSGSLRNAAIMGTNFMMCRMRKTKITAALVGEVPIIASTGQTSGKLRRTSFAGSDLRDAELAGLDLSRCDLDKVRGLQ